MTDFYVPCNNVLIHWKGERDVDHVVNCLRLSLLWQF